MKTSLFIFIFCDNLIHFDSKFINLSEFFIFQKSLTIKFRKTNFPLSLKILQLDNLHRKKEEINF